MGRKGFTLIELIVSLIIFSVFISGLFYSFKVNLGFWEKITGQCEKEQIAGFVLARITRDGRVAKEVLPGSSQHMLRLQIGADIIEYSLYNNKVKRKKNNYSSYLTDVDDINNLGFSFPSPGLVAVTIEDLSTTIYLRN
ncbi:MAG: type II secretion system protein [Candidatus Margulisiibacteriota bacterium]|nr:type II secretion system protein [Candidatus Margulisiibacteriota bacterium]